MTYTTVTDAQKNETSNCTFLYSSGLNFWMCMYKNASASGGSRLPDMAP